MFKKLVMALGLTLGVVSATPSISQATLQPYQARVAGDTIQFTLSQITTNPPNTPYRTPGGPVSPDPCPVGSLQLFSVPYVGTPHPGPAYQSGTVYSVGQYQSLYLALTPCNTNPGDTIEVKILASSQTTSSFTYVNVSTDGWVTSVKAHNSPQAHLDLLVTDLNTAASSTITVVGAP